MNLLSLEIWAHGLGSAAITGAMHAIPVALIDPATFNLQAGLSKLFTVAIAGGIVSTTAYLAKSPLPPMDPPGPSAAATSPVAAALMITGLALVGCAGTRADRDFRSKVKSSTTSVQVASGENGYGGTITNTLEFRDPSDQPASRVSVAPVPFNSREGVVSAEPAPFDPKRSSVHLLPAGFAK